MIVSGIVDSYHPAFDRMVHWSVLLLFNLFLFVSWMPRITMLGGTDIGVSAIFLTLLAPLIVIARRPKLLDQQALLFRQVIVFSIIFVLVWGYFRVFGLEQPLRAGRLFLSLGQGIILIYTVTLVMTARAVCFSLFLCAIMLAVSSFLSLYNYLGGEPLSLTYLGADRSSGLFKNPNQFGMIAAMVTPFAVAFYYQKGQRWPATFLLLVTLLALLMSASKTNLVVALLLIFLTMGYSLLALRRIGTMTIVLPFLLVLVAIAGLPLLEYFNPRAANIMQSKLLEGDLYDSTVNQRFELWRHSVDVIRTSPWFGEGPGQRIDVITQHYSHSHNVFLDIGRTVGMPGLVGALSFLLAACVLAFKTLNRIAALPPQIAVYLHRRALVVGAAFAVLSYILSNQMSDSLGPSTSSFFWLCLALLLKRDELLFSGIVVNPSISEAPGRIATGSIRATCPLPS